MTELAAVDTQPEMLEELLTRANKRGLSTTAVVGQWPEVAPRTPAADVVVCHHVLYNVPDIVPFVQALDQHARRRVVIELTAAHPLSGLNPLWRHFHQLQRPERPTWRDAMAARCRPGPAGRAQPSRRGAVDHGHLRGHRSDDPPEALPRWLAETDVVAELGKMGVRPEDSRSWSLGSPEIATLWWESARGGRST